MLITNKAFINGKIYDVIELNQINQIGLNTIIDSLAIHINGFVLPVYSCGIVYDRPGFYLNDCISSHIVYPNNEEKEIYSDSHLAYFGSASTFQDVVDAKEKIYKDEYNHLISNDEVFTPNIDQVNDTALMFAVKSAITAKHCNINNYAERFGSDFNNDKRKFNGNSITAGKAESILSNTDVRVTLVIQDMNPNVANPIGKTLVFPWIGDGINDEEYINYINNAISAFGPIKLGGDEND